MTSMSLWAAHTSYTSGTGLNHARQLRKERALFPPTCRRLRVVDISARDRKRRMLLNPRLPPSPVPPVFSPPLSAPLHSALSHCNSFLQFLNLPPLTQPAYRDPKTGPPAQGSPSPRACYNTSRKKMRVKRRFHAGVGSSRSSDSAFFLMQSAPRPPCRTLRAVRDRKKGFRTGKSFATQPDC